VLWDEADRTLAALANRPEPRLDIRNGGCSVTIQDWFDPSAFVPVPSGDFRYGDSGINILRGPRFADVDFSSYKHFSLREWMNWEFRAEFFNVLNHPNFGLPQSTVGLSSTGQISATTGDPRIVQFGLKMNF
jgi:hypothetical protein